MMNYGVMDDPAFDWRSEVSAQKCPINHHRIVFGQPRMYKSDFLPLPLDLFNKWIQHWRRSKGAR